MALEKSELQGVLWIPTARLAIARGIVSGCIWFIVIVSVDLPAELGVELAPLVFFLTISMPVSYAIIRFFDALLGWLGLVALALTIIVRLYSLLVCVGDPVIYVINKKFPNVFGVPHFGLVNFFMVMFVKHPEAMD